MNAKQHRTHHAAEAVDGWVIVGCTCGWIEKVKVYGLSWVEAMERIYMARDRHQQETA